MARDVLGLSGDIDCRLEPLADGLNFLSDAYFVNVKNESTEISLFVKVNLLVIQFGSLFHCLQVPPKTNQVRQQLFDSLADQDLFQREFHFYNSVCNLFKITIEDEDEDVKDILNFIPHSLTLQGNPQPRIGATWHGPL